MSDMDAVEFGCLLIEQAAVLDEDDGDVASMKPDDEIELVWTVSVQIRRKGTDDDFQTKLLATFPAMDAVKPLILTCAKVSTSVFSPREIHVTGFDKQFCKEIGEFCDGEEFKGEIFPCRS